MKETTVVSRLLTALTYAVFFGAMAVAFIIYWGGTDHTFGGFLNPAGAYCGLWLVLYVLGVRYGEMHSPVQDATVNLVAACVTVAAGAIHYVAGLVPALIFVTGATAAIVFGFFALRFVLHGR